MTKQKKLEEGGGTFEQDLERLEEIVAALEEGGLPLENSLKQFEEGIALSRRCERRLREAIRVLTWSTPVRRSMLQTRRAGWPLRWLRELCVSMGSGYCGRVLV